MSEDPDEMLDLAHFLRDRFPDDAPREPGHAAIRMGGDPVVYEVTVTCDRCGRTCTSSGVRFGDPIPCPTHPGIDCLSIHVHWGETCPAWASRRWRWINAVTWPIERRWKSWKWRRHMKTDRNDPEAWAHFWADEEDHDA